MRRRRPLLGAAMIGGTAYMAGKAGQRGEDREMSQEERLQQLEAQQAPPPPAAAPAAGGVDLAGQLTSLKTMVDQGVLTPAEFETAKQKLLAG